MSSATALVDGDVIHVNMDTADALRIAERLGCRVERGKGAEVKLYHAQWNRWISINGTRKTAPRILTVQLRKLADGTLKRRADPAHAKPSAPDSTPDEKETAMVSDGQLPTVLPADAITARAALKILGMSPGHTADKVSDVTGIPFVRFGVAAYFSRAAIEAKRDEVAAWRERRLREGRAKSIAVRRAHAADKAKASAPAPAVDPQALDQLRADIAAVKQLVEAGKTLELDELARVTNLIEAMRARMDAAVQAAEAARTAAVAAEKRALDAFERVARVSEKLTGITDTIGDIAKNTRTVNKMHDTINDISSRVDLIGATIAIFIKREREGSSTQVSEALEKLANRIPGVR